MTEISDKFPKGFNIIRNGDKPPLPRAMIEKPEQEYPGPTLGQRINYSFYTLPEKIARAVYRLVSWYGGPGPEDM